MGFSCVGWGYQLYKYPLNIGWGCATSQGFTLVVVVGNLHPLPLLLTCRASARPWGLDTTPLSLLLGLHSPGAPPHHWARRLAGPLRPGRLGISRRPCASHQPRVGCYPAISALSPLGHHVYTFFYGFSALPLASLAPLTPSAFGPSVATTRLHSSQLGKSDSKRVSTRSAVGSFLATRLGSAVDLKST